MSVYLRLEIGRVVLIDCDLLRFRQRATDRNPDEPPPQLAGGTGTVLYPEDERPPLGFA